MDTKVPLDNNPEGYRTNTETVAVEAEPMEPVAVDRQRGQAPEPLLDLHMLPPILLPDMDIPAFHKSTKTHRLATTNRTDYDTIGGANFLYAKSLTLMGGEMVIVPSTEVMPFCRMSN